MANITAKQMTDEDLLNRYGQVAGTIYAFIFNYLQENPIGVAVTAETGFYTRGNKRTVRAPDAAFIHKNNVPEAGLPDRYSFIVPELAS